ncbi:MAG TPA: glycosyltransferase family 39 protein [Gemmatimonadaceae bacterium]|jgi:hypothetical protein|nr:glycosyltransferase family 39 protein [Gemmatimonadaceae bacterium]
MTDRAVRWVVVISIVCGAALRCIEVAQAHTFGFDDTMLALNIVTRSAARLAQPLSFQQTAPVLFLWIDRLLVDLAPGAASVVLRLLPLAGGIAILPLTWVVGRRLVSESAAALTVALLAVSPLAVDYTDRPKPYILDAAVALGLIGLTLWVIREPQRRRAWAILAATGAVATLLSTPAVFTLAACGVALLIALAPATRRGGRETAWLVALGGIWIAVELVNYLAFQRTTNHDVWLQRFWGPAFFTPTAHDLPARVRIVASSFMENLFYGTSLRPRIALRILVTLLAVIGAVRAWRRPGPWALVLLVGPLVLAVLASAARVYPPSDRTWLFAAPSVALLAASGVELLCGRLPARARRPAFIAIGLAGLFLPARQSWLTLRAFLRPDGLGAAMRAWDAASHRGAPIYVFARDAIRWTYYTTDWAHPDTARLNWLMTADSVIGPNSGNAPTRGHAVHDEGDSLIYRGAARVELIGIPTGMEDRMMIAADSEPDSGWADNEARRLAAAATPSIWMFFLYTKPRIDSLVIAAAERRGAQLTSANHFETVRLYHLRFNAPPAHVP